jgi:hypothetical protein
MRGTREKGRPNGFIFIAGFLVGAVGIELVGHLLSLAESTALTPLQLSNSPPKPLILDTIIVGHGF